MVCHTGSPASARCTRSITELLVTKDSATAYRAPASLSSPVCHTGSPRWSATQAATYSMALSISPLPPQLGVGLSLDRPPSSIPQVPHPVPCPTCLPGQLPILHRSCLPPSRILSASRVSAFTPADAVPLHHCSIRLQPLLLEHPHPTGSRLHLAELLRLAAVDSSHVLSQQHLDRVAHVLGSRAFARTSSNMFCRFPRSSTAAPTFCTSRVHRTRSSSPIFAPQPILLLDRYRNFTRRPVIAKLSTM